MNEPDAPIQLPKDAPGDCEIWVRGWLDPNWFEVYDNLEGSISAHQEHAPAARLTGRLADQSALVGIIVALHQFGLTLLSVEWQERET